MVRKQAKPAPSQNSNQPPPFIGTESEVRLQRYRQVEREADAMGRLIGVRRLKPSEQGRLQGMTSDLGGQEEVENSETGEIMKVSHKAPYFIAAAVCEIDGVHITFPRHRGELDAIYDRLDIEGISAAATALARLNPRQEQLPEYLEGEGEVDGEGEEVLLNEAKNS